MGCVRSDVVAVTPKPRTARCMDDVECAVRVVERVHVTHFHGDIAKIALVRGLPGVFEDGRLPIDSHNLSGGHKFGEICREGPRTTSDIKEPVAAGEMRHQILCRVLSRAGPVGCQH